MADSACLRISIIQYEQQLNQIEKTLSTTKDGSDRENLLSLKSDIKELIELTKENLEEIEINKNKDDYGNTLRDMDKEDPLAEEYALFQKELQDVSENSTISEETSADSSNIEDELKALEGLKCRAPYNNNWGSCGYHNAMICTVYKNEHKDIKNLQDIMVRVLFINPTHKDMLPCPFFLNGNCKFDDDKCHYSHGEITSFSSLQEYREPEYHDIKTGSRVLAKNENNLWLRAIVLKVPDKEEDPYCIKLESNGNFKEIPVQDILPISDTDIVDTMDESDSDSDIETSVEKANEERDQIIQKSLESQHSKILGNWEKHTRGIGSKLMAQMGYIVGTGLGKRAEGRLEPVEVSILPAGKSLDHCMELRESTGGSNDIFSMEHRMRKQQLSIEKQSERQYQKQKQQEKHNVFNFLNTTLGDKRNDNKVTSETSRNKASLKKESNQNLKIASFQINENISKLEKQSSKLKNSLSRHMKGSPLYNNIVLQYNEKQKELHDLKTSEKNICDEQNSRRNKAKLSIF